MFGIEHLDKVIHALMYFGLALTLMVENSVYLLDRKLNNIYITVFTIAFGLLMEASQQLLTSYRTADLIDSLANGMGAIIALIVFHYQASKIKSNWLVAKVLNIKNQITRL